MSPFEQLLMAIGRDPGERVAISYGEPLKKDDFHTLPINRVSFAPGQLAAHLQRNPNDNCWFGPQVLREGELTGRGKKVDIIRVASLNVDLDLKESGVGTGPAGLLAARSIIADLSDILGTPPAAIVFSGHGLQPHWRFDHANASIEAVLPLYESGFRRLVEHVASRHGAKVDPTFDLSRVMRIPGTVNSKEQPFVSCSATVEPDARLVTFATLQQAVALYAPPEPPRAPRAVTAAGAGVIPAGKSLRYPSILAELGTPIPHGEHDNTLTSFAARLRAHGASHDEAQTLTDLRMQDCVSVGDYTSDWGSGKVASAFEKFAPPCDCVSIFCSRDPHTASAEARKNKPITRTQTLAQPPTVVQLWADSEQTVVVDASTGAPMTKDGFTLPDVFWCRPVLQFLRQAAQSKKQSPEGVVVAALCATLAHTMPNVWLPATIASEASLNLMGVVVGPSGLGKSACRKIVNNALKFEGIERVYEYPPGSGQGVAAQYQYLSKSKGEQHMEPIRWNAMAVVEESDRIAALTTGQGSILSAELRSAAMGELIGSANVGDTKTHMKEGTYRFVMWMCMQPELSGWLLDEKAGGLPQRFLWCCVLRNPEHDPAVLPEWPGIRSVVLPHECYPHANTGIPQNPAVLVLAESIVETVQRQADELMALAYRRWQSLEAGQLPAGRSADDYDGHATLLRLKAAAALALLESRLDVNEEDWWLAGMLLTCSKETIAFSQTHLDAMDMQKARKVTRAKVAEAKAITAATTDEAHARQLASTTDRVLKLLADNPGMRKGKLQARLSANQQGVLGEVLDGLINLGKIKFEDVLDAQGNQTGSNWWLS